MPEGQIEASTLALSAVGGVDETSNFYRKALTPGLLKEGPNVVVVEIHQARVTSTDISFDLELTGTLAPVAPSIQLTSPANNSIYFAPATVSLVASAVDSENGIAWVAFFNEGVRLGEDTSAPFSSVFCPLR